MTLFCVHTHRVSLFWLCIQNENCSLGQHLPHQDELGDGRRVIRCFSFSFPRFWSFSCFYFLQIHNICRVLHWRVKIKIRLCSVFDRFMTLCFVFCRDDPDPQRHGSPSVCPVRTATAGALMQIFVSVWIFLCIFWWCLTELCCSVVLGEIFTGHTSVFRTAGRH